MAQDLRTFIEAVKRAKPDDVVVVKKEVDPAYEITALVVKLERELKRRPVLIFENVKGTKFPVITNLHASRGRLAAAIGASPEGMLKKYREAMETPIPPRVVATGPVKEVILRGDQVDLYALPQILGHDYFNPYRRRPLSFRILFFCASVRSPRSRMSSMDCG